MPCTFPLTLLLDLRHSFDTIPPIAHGQDIQSVVLGRLKTSTPIRSLARAELEVQPTTSMQVVRRVVPRDALAGAETRTCHPEPLLQFSKILS